MLCTFNVVVYSGYAMLYLIANCDLSVLIVVKLPMNLLRCVAYLHLYA